MMSACKLKANWKDPNWKYHNAAESAKTGYLEKRMKIYMEMVKNESAEKLLREAFSQVWPCPKSKGKGA